MRSARPLRGLLAALGALAAAQRGAPAGPPSLGWDRSPVGTGSGPVASYADAVEPARKAVVAVYSSAAGSGREEDLGSGVIVTADGYLLTNNHVVEGAGPIGVRLSDERRYRARLVGADPKTDVAVLKIEAVGLPSLILADSDRLRVGDIVFAVGNPLHVGETVTMGIVSAKGRKLGLLGGGFEDYIQTDAAINLGNSGGALIDAKGRLVGINSALVSPRQGSVGIGFAVPVNLAAGVLERLVAADGTGR